jgi:tetratricopeptide (TPR) repeat protein
MRAPKTITTVAWLCFVTPAIASVGPSELRAQGDEHEYNLQFEQALSRYTQAVDADPADPASYRAVAATYFLRIAFLRGAVTADTFLGGGVESDTLDVPKPPAELATAFRTNAERALRLAEQQVQRRPNDAEAHYQLGATIALLASYSATVDGQVFAAFKFARNAYKENSRALELDPRRKDAGLIVGAYQYVVSTRSMPVRILARIGGLDGNKAQGIEMIEAAARYPGENQTDARFLLVLIYNREQRYDDALKVLAELQGRYPGNRLLWLEAGGTALRAGRFQDGKHILDGGFAKLSEGPAPRAFGEEALWHYKRGACLVGLRRDADAALDLRTALQKEARGWVHARAHTELGKLADVISDRTTARQEYRIALQLAKAADDPVGVATAEQLLSKPYVDNGVRRETVSAQALRSPRKD